MNNSKAITYAYGNLFKCFMGTAFLRVFVDKIAGNIFPHKMYIDVGTRQSHEVINTTNKETKMSKKMGLEC
jgi:hypothetical protein